MALFFLFHFITAVLHLLHCSFAKPLRESLWSVIMSCKQTRNTSVHKMIDIFPINKHTA